MCTAFGRRRAGALVLVLGLGLVVACGGAENGCSVVGAVAVEGAGGVSDDDVGVDDAAVGAAAVGVVECVGIAVDGTRGRRGVSDVGNADSNVVEVEQVCWMLKEKVLRLVGAFQAVLKNGWEVVV